MATPREEVLLSQQMSNGLKPDRTTSQPSAPQRPATTPTNPEKMRPQRPMIPAQAPLSATQSADPTVSQQYAARSAEIGMYNSQRAVENAAPGRQTGAGTMVQPRIGGNGRDATAMAVRAMPARPAASAVPTVAAVAQQPAIAQQAPGAGVLKQPPSVAPQVQPSAVPARPQLRPGDLNTYQRGNGEVVPVQPAAPGAVVAAPARAAPAYEMPQAYNGPVPQRPASANIAGGMTRQEIIRQMDMVTGDSNYKGSPIARKAKLDALGAMLGDYDKAEISRESNAQNIQQTAVAGQAAGAAEMQRGQQRRAENIYAQQGAETLKTMDQNAPSEITDAEGNTFLRRGASTEAVLGPDGKQIKGAKAAPQPNQRLDALIKLQAAEAKDRLPGEAAPANDPVSAAIKQELGLAGGQSAAPDFATWSAAAKKQYPNATPEQIKAGYDSQFNTGAK